MAESSPFSSKEPSQIEKNLMWQEQFLKGVVHGIPATYWRVITQLVIHVSKAINDAKLLDIENINEAHQKGYDLSQTIINSALQGLIPDD